MGHVSFYKHHLRFETTCECGVAEAGQDLQPPEHDHRFRPRIILLPGLCSCDSFCFQSTANALVDARVLCGSVAQASLMLMIQILHYL